MTDDIIARLRAELAKERERADAHYRVLECVSSKRDELRAELAAERERTKAIEEELDLREQEDCNEENYLQSQVDKLTAERDALRALLKEALDYIDDPYNDLAISIGAALNKGGGDE